MQRRGSGSSGRFLILLPDHGGQRLADVIATPLPSSGQSPRPPSAPGRPFYSRSSRQPGRCRCVAASPPVSPAGVRGFDLQDAAGVPRDAPNRNCRDRIRQARIDWCTFEVPSPVRMSGSGGNPQLADRHDRDRGVLVSRLMDHVVLEHADAIYLPAGKLHAYPSGTGWRSWPTRTACCEVV